MLFAKQVIIPRQYVSEVASAKENPRRKFSKVEPGRCATQGGCDFLPNIESNSSEPIEEIGNQDPLYR